MTNKCIEERERNQIVFQCPSGVKSLPLVWISRSLFVLTSGRDWLFHITGKMLVLQGCAKNSTGDNHRDVSFSVEHSGSVMFSSRKLLLHRGGDE